MYIHFSKKTNFKITKISHPFFVLFQKQKNLEYIIGPQHKSCNALKKIKNQGI